MLILKLQNSQDAKAGNRYDNCRKPDFSRELLLNIRVSYYSSIIISFSNIVPVCRMLNGMQACIVNVCKIVISMLPVLVFNGCLYYLETSEILF